ncbi:MAG: hypothetical protein AAB579_01560 [Patescibacteria group bacterium]
MTIDGLLTKERIVRETGEHLRNFLDQCLQQGSTWFGEQDQQPPPEVVAQEEIACFLWEMPHPEADTLRKYEVVDGRVFVKKKPAPFLLFEDAGFLITRWCNAHGKPAPNRKFFDHLTNAHYALVKRFFPEAFLLRTTDFLRPLAAHRQQTQPWHDWPVITISLDTDFVRGTHGAVEITRVRDHETFNFLGELARPGEPPVKEQIAAIGAIMPKRHALQFVSDGCWEGSEILMLEEYFRRRNIMVDGTVCGVLCRKAVDNFNDAGMPASGSHPYLGLESWICQRDLLPGVPRSGLNLGMRVGNRAQALAENIGATYLLPFREDVFDELTPHDLTEFSLYCYRLADGLFAKLERLWQRPILVRDLARVPKYVRLGQIRFRDELRRIAREFLKTRDALGPCI